MADQKPSEAVHRGADELPFVDIGDGNKLKVIQVDRAEGLWIVENIFQAGYVVQKHRHTGPVYGYTTRGAWHYQEYDYVNRAGSFLEPAGCTPSSARTNGSRCTGRRPRCRGKRRLRRWRGAPCRVPRSAGRHGLLRVLDQVRVDQVLVGSRSGATHKSRRARMHRNAPLTPEGRPPHRTSMPEERQTAPVVGSLEQAGLDRSSRPYSCPHQTVPCRASSPSAGPAGGTLAGWPVDTVRRRPLRPAGPHREEAGSTGTKPVQADTSPSDPTASSLAERQLRRLPDKACRADPHRQRQRLAPQMGELGIKPEHPRPPRVETASAYASWK